MCSSSLDTLFFSPFDNCLHPETETVLKPSKPSSDNALDLQFSIVTPSYNRAGMIETAIHSVLNQNYSEFEHIIIDGGSTDGTLDVLKKYSHLRVISEPDHGMYEAINKGVKLAQGEFLGFLNSDDTYPPGIFEEVAQAFAANPNVDVIWGGADEVRQLPDGSMQQLRVTYPLEQPDLVYRFLNESPNFNACFFRRSVFDHFGLLSINFSIVSDLEFMLRLYFGGGHFFRVNRVYYHYLVHEGSLTFGGAAPEEKVKEEMCQVCEYFLNQNNIPSEARTIFRRMHTNWCLYLGRLAFESGKYRLSADYLRRAKELDFFWCAVFLRKILRVTQYRLSEKLKRKKFENEKN